jgi:hypothetical protein
VHDQDFGHCDSFGVRTAGIMNTAAAAKNSRILSVQ